MESEAWLLFEGACPNNPGEHEVRMISVSGTKEFLEQQQYEGVDKIYQWHSQWSRLTDGEIEFRCDRCDQTWCVAHNVYGDWSM